MVSLTGCCKLIVFVTVEGLKVVEIEKCKNDLKKLRDEMTSRGGVRYGRLLFFISFHFSNSIRVCYLFISCNQRELQLQIQLY